MPVMPRTVIQVLEVSASALGSEHLKRFKKVRFNSSIIILYQKTGSVIKNGGFTAKIYGLIIK